MLQYMRLPTADGDPSLLKRQEPVPTVETAPPSLACSKAGEVATNGKYS